MTINLMFKEELEPLVDNTLFSPIMKLGFLTWKSTERGSMEELKVADI